MTKKIFRSIFLVTICILLVSTVVIFGVSYEYFNSQIMTELSQEADYVAAGIEEGGNEYLNKLQEKTMRITIVNSTGKVLYDNKADPDSMDNHLDREEVKAANETGSGSCTRYSHTLSERTMYFALKMSDGNILRVSSTQYSLWVIVFSMLQPIVVIILIALVLAGILSYRISIKIVKPINNIDLDNPDNTKVYEELQPVVNRIIAQNRSIKKQIEELRRKQTEFNAITDNMSEGMIIIDNKADILSCNKCALNMLSLPLNMPKNIVQLNVSESFRNAIRLSLLGKKANDCIHKNKKFYSVFFTPVIYDSSVEGSVIVIIDETEKEERDVLRREFTANVSHELKTPLTSISGFAELIKNGITDKADTIHFADNIYNEAHRLISLVGDIIRLSQLEDGEISYDSDPVDICEIVKDTYERLKNVADSKHVLLKIMGNNCFIKGNSVILDEMIYNLVDNGIKYNHPGGYVKVDVKNDNNKIILSVEDDGIGIPIEQQDRIFERFYCVDKSHSKEVGGTGLGLSIVKHGVQYHNAQLDLKSDIGKGTNITISFPIA